MQEKNFNALFNGTTGHNLHFLSDTASLRRYLAASGNEALLETEEWDQMAGGRPFSIRYGAETVPAEQARNQVTFATKLVNLMLQGTP
jgi:hypothetical protein